MRRLVPGTAALVLVAVASAAPKGHPHFDDGGTIRWHTKLADAAAEAKREGKLVLIEYGRKL